MQKLKARCVISGGGPAGIMLGYLLGRAGIDVVVLEKWPDFFRDFRGDTIHPSTMQNLYELGLLEKFLKLPHQKTRRMTIKIGEDDVTVADFAHVKTRCPYIAVIPTTWPFSSSKFIASVCIKILKDGYCFASSAIKFKKSH